MRKKYLHNGSKIPTKVVNKVNYYVKVDMPHLSFERALIDLMDRKEVILDCGKWSIIKRDRVRKAPYAPRKKKAPENGALVTCDYPLRSLSLSDFQTLRKSSSLRFVPDEKNYYIRPTLYREGQQVLEKTDVEDLETFDFGLD